MIWTRLVTRAARPTTTSSCSRTTARRSRSSPTTKETKMNPSSKLKHFYFSDVFKKNCSQEIKIKFHLIILRWVSKKKFSHSIHNRLCEFHRHSVTSHDYKTLADEEFLNDAIVNFYLTFLFERLSEPLKDAIQIFSSHFYSRLKG